MENKHENKFRISYSEINHLDITFSKEGEQDVLLMRDGGTEKALRLSGIGYEEKYYAKANYTISESSFDFQKWLLPIEKS